ncbi:hypothetical protein FCULG_00007573 [Fusarium culmorum]|uniref:Uncharacterized protein n=1 Tax=Fusarium culmorum TaxID=5516 RepID=A0A2T4H0P6_FUSCU|nr:hypothetical protein FCULG_00007573 [Fusarium culmorum]
MLQVVDEASACLSELARLPLKTDHIKLNKYSSPEDQSYLRVSAEIVRMCNNAVVVMNRLNNGDESPSTDHGGDPSQHDEGVIGHQGSEDRHLERTSPFEAVIEGLGGIGGTQIGYEVDYTDK